jgi:transcriptional regulator with XRE-family HTH domain
MKTTKAIRGLLGLTQVELSLVLQVSRSQLAKYELGMRDLPLASMALLEAMLEHVQSPEVLAKSPRPAKGQQEKKFRHLKNMLEETEYQLSLLSRKIEGVEARQTAKIRAFHTAKFLSQRPGNYSQTEKNLLKSISKKAEHKALKMDEAGDLEKYQLQQEMLKMQKSWLESKMRTSSQTHPTK